MSIVRLQTRLPSARWVAVGSLTEHRLRFHKESQDGSAKCDAEQTSDPEDKVIGVVYDIADDEKPILDRIEGLGSGYEIKKVEVTTDQGILTAFMYYATQTTPRFKPYRWYKQHVLVGARENGLPPEYIAQIEAVEAIVDPDAERRKSELAIYDS